MNQNKTGTKENASVNHEIFLLMRSRFSTHYTTPTPRGLLIVSTPDDDVQGVLLCLCRWGRVSCWWDLGRSALAARLGDMVGMVDVKMRRLEAVSVIISVLGIGVDGTLLK